MAYVKQLVVLAAVVAGTAFGEPAGGRIEGYDKLLPTGDETLRVDSATPRTKPEAVGPVEERETDPRKLVETVMMVRMAEELMLDDEQTVTMVRRLRELKDEMSQLRRERWALYRALKEALREEADANGIRATLSELLEHDRALETFKQDRLDELGEGLTTAQQARLYIFLCEFEDDMRHLVRRAQGRDGHRPDGDYGRGGRNDGAGHGASERKPE